MGGGGAAARFFFQQHYSTVVYPINSNPISPALPPGPSIIGKLPLLHIVEPAVVFCVFAGLGELGGRARATERQGGEERGGGRETEADRERDGDGRAEMKSWTIVSSNLKAERK